MASSFWYSLSSTTGRHEKLLVRIGVAALLSFFVLMILLMGFQGGKNELLVMLMFVSIIFVFWCCGFGLVRYYFSGLEQKFRAGRFMVLYAKVFMSFWFLALAGGTLVVFTGLVKLLVD